MTPPDMQVTLAMAVFNRDRKNAHKRVEVFQRILVNMQLLDWLETQPPKQLLCQFYIASSFSQQSIKPFN